MKQIQYAYAVFLLFLVVGCAQLGLPTPQSFEEKLAVGYSTVTAVRQSALTLLQAKKLTPPDAQNIQNQADQARAGLDVARSLQAQLPLAAADKLTAVNLVLQSIQTYLTSRSK